MFRLLPSLMGFAISLFKWKGVSLNMKYITDNFIRLFTKDDIFMKALGNHFYIYLLNTVIVSADRIGVLITKSNMRDRNFTASCSFSPRWCRRHHQCAVDEAS